MDQDCQAVDSLFDYLYLDKERVGYFTAQLFPSGVLSTVKQISSSSEHSLNELKGGVSLFNARKNAGDSFAKTQERHFDSSWSLPLNFFDKLHEQGLVATSLENAEIGSLVMVKGHIKLFDVKMAHDVLPIYKDAKQKELKQTKSPAQKKDIQEEIYNAKIAADMFSLLPFSTQIELLDDQENIFWMSVKADDLALDVGNLALKYGSRIPGEWYVIGVIDALPDISDETVSESIFPSDEIRGTIDYMLEGIRGMIGRSETSYGMTPLVIFRKVS